MKAEMVYGRSMDTMNLSRPSRLSIGKRHLFFLGIGGVFGILLDYCTLPPNNPLVSIAIGVGLLVVAVIARSLNR